METTVGSMRDRVIIQKEALTADSGGGWINAWQNVATVSAKVKPVSVSDNVRALALALSITHKFTIRWRRDIGTSDGHRYRLMWNGTPVRIIGVMNPDGKKRFLELTCETGQGVAT